jgi:hypothetical protein
MKLSAFVLLLIVISTPLFAGKLPEYKEYPAVKDFHGKPVPPVLSSSKARMMRTQLQHQAASGPNFAGHFTLARWGCGAGCVSWAIIDALSGNVWFSPFYVTDATNLSNLECGQHSMDFRIDSELIIVNGAIDPDDENAGTFYYRWHDGSLTLLYSQECQPK